MSELHAVKRQGKRLMRLVHCLVIPSMLQHRVKICLVHTPVHIIVHKRRVVEIWSFINYYVVGRLKLWVQVFNFFFSLVVKSVLLDEDVGEVRLEEVRTANRVQLCVLPLAVNNPMVLYLCSLLDLSGLNNLLRLNVDIWEIVGSSSRIFKFEFTIQRILQGSLWPADLIPYYFPPLRFFEGRRGLVEHGQPTSFPPALDVLRVIIILTWLAHNLRIGCSPRRPWKHKSIRPVHRVHLDLSVFFYIIQVGFLPVRFLIIWRQFGRMKNNTYIRSGHPTSWSCWWSTLCFANCGERSSA